MGNKMLLTLLSFGSLILQAVAGNYWLNPSQQAIVNDFSEDPSYILGSFLNLAWVTDYSSVEILLWQVNSTSSETLFDNLGGDGSQAMQWHVTTNKSLTNPFFLGFYDHDDSNNYSLSQYFNIVDGTTSSSSSSSTTPTSTLAVSSTVTPKATATATSSPASAPTPTQIASTGLSEQAKIGVGVGVGLGGLLVLLGLALFLWRRFGSNPTGTVEAAYPSTLPPYTDASYYSPEKDGPASPPHQVLHNQIFEAADSRAESVHELEDSQGLRSR